VVKEEEDENYRPYDTLKVIGFTKDEAKGFLTNIESAASSQLPPEPKKAPDIEVKFRAQKTQLRHAQFRNLFLIVGGYAFAVLIYVIMIQVLHPDWLYAPLATRLPIRLDYVGDAAFVALFVIMTGVTMLNTKRAMQTERQQTGSKRHVS